MTTGNEFRQRRLTTQERARSKRVLQAAAQTAHDQRRTLLRIDALAGRRVPTPSRITCALDLCGLDGPQVDADLGVLEDPPVVVDEWEAGRRVPTWDNIVALAALTNMLPEWFYGPVMPDTGTAFVCPA